MLKPKYQSQVEYVLDRPLSPAEMVEAPSLEKMTPAVLQVATLLAQRQLVVCTIYLHSLTPARGPKLQQFVAKLSGG